MVVDDKKQKEEAKKVKLSGKEIKTQKLEEVVSKQKEFSAKNLRKLMKEYEKQDLKAKEEKGEDIDLNFTRNDSTVVDSMASMRSMAFWDSIRTVPLTTAEVKSYTRLDSIGVITEGTQEQKDSLKVSKSDTTKKNKGGGGFGFWVIFLPVIVSVRQKKSVAAGLCEPLLGAQVNTVEGLVLNGGGLKLRYLRATGPGKCRTVSDIGSNGVKRFAAPRSQRN